MAGEITENLLRNAEEAAEKQSSTHKIWNESKKIWIVASPAMFCRFTTFGTGVITQAFIGHVGSKELAAFALVFTVFVRFAQGILLGMANGLETLCWQAYGARQYHMLGIYLQRSWIVSIIASAVILPVFVLTAPILRADGGVNGGVDDSGGVFVHSCLYLPDVSAGAEQEHDHRLLGRSFFGVARVSVVAADDEIRVWCGGSHGFHGYSVLAS